MPANPYSTIASNLITEYNDVSAAFSNAQTELGTQGAPETFFLEISYSGGKIVRNWDGIQVNTLSLAEQWRLYPQLGGLFNLAMRKLLYP